MDSWTGKYISFRWAKPNRKAACQISTPATPAFLGQGQITAWHSPVLPPFSPHLPQNETRAKASFLQGHGLNLGSAHWIMTGYPWSLLLNLAQYEDFMLCAVHLWSDDWTFENDWRPNPALAKGSGCISSGHYWLPKAHRPRVCYPGPNPSHHQVFFELLKYTRHREMLSKPSWISKPLGSFWKMQILHNFSAILKLF